MQHHFCLHGITYSRMLSVNAFHAAGECRRQGKNLTKFVTNVEIVEFHDHIWNHNEKCIQISTNMPGIGSLIREIVVKMLELSTILLSKTKSRVVSVNTTSLGISHNS